MQYKTPGVYIDEISTLPPSVAEVATAIPAFIGYTERSPSKGEPVEIEVIRTMLEYEQRFGGPKPAQFKVIVDSDTITCSRTDDKPEKPVPTFFLHEALTLYFKNGGGRCYVVSVGSHDARPTDAKKLFLAGLAALERHDEPTLIVAPEAVGLKGTDFFSLAQQTLKQCKKLQDRFAIFDVPGGKDGAGDFRTKVGQEDLDYGAAYLPYLQTALTFAYVPSEVEVYLEPPQHSETLGGVIVRYVGFEKLPKVQVKSQVDEPPVFEIHGDELIMNVADMTGRDVVSKWQAWAPRQPDIEFSVVANDHRKSAVEAPEGGLTPQDTGWGAICGGVIVDYTDKSLDATPELVIEKGTVAPVSFTTREGKLTITNVRDKTGTVVADAWEKWTNIATNVDHGFSVSVNDQSGNVVELTGPKPLELVKDEHTTLDKLANSDTALYNQIKKCLRSERVTLPPSPAIAGVYVSVDRDRGVWKAPANVSLSAVIGPTERITADDQERLNVDVTSGKSINAIRAFTGKGTLVWGARTLDGNSNEWRYVPVRRLFITIEESARKATAFAVFEPNDAGTWLKVKGMLESYLYGLWERGALQGSKPETAYFVEVGLGRTMTPQDVLEGRMIVKIGVAAVRPAEFIILQFSHKLAEA